MLPLVRLAALAALLLLVCGGVSGTQLLRRHHSKLQRAAEAAAEAAKYNEDNGYLHAKDHYGGDKKAAHYFHGDHDVQESDENGKTLLGTQFGEASPVPVMTETVQGVHLDKHMDEEQSKTKKHDEGEPVFAGADDDRDEASSTQADDAMGGDNNGQAVGPHRHTSIRVSMNNENHLHGRQRRRKASANGNGKRNSAANNGLGAPTNADSDIQVAMNNQNHIPSHHRRHNRTRSGTHRYRYDNEDHEDEDIMHPRYNMV